MTEPSAPDPTPALPTEPAVVAQEGEPVNLTALVAEAATKSGLLWIEVPGGRTWPAWHVWHEGRVLLVSGPGEQHVPGLPTEVRLILRSKDSGGRLLVVNGQVETLWPGTPEWDEAFETLRPERLNAASDLKHRWATEGTIRSITPFGAPVEAPGSMLADDGRMLVHPGPAATASWRPWHLGGRPQRRRRLR